MQHMLFDPFRSAPIGRVTVSKDSPKPVLKPVETPANTQAADAGLGRTPNREAEPFPISVHGGAGDPEVHARLALITGASAGIGEAFARLYADKGYDVALVARRRDRLENLAHELHQKHGRFYYVIPADLSLPNAAEGVLEGLARKGRYVDVLVNNAGYGLSGGFAGTKWDDQARFLQVMVDTGCALTHRVLPGMLARKYGRIIHVASLAGQAPASAGHTLYAASKAFMIKFTESLADECAGSGVHVTAVCPGFTRSEFHDAAGTRDIVDKALPGFMWSKACRVAEAAYRASETNKTVITPGAVNKAIATLCKIAPDDWTRAWARGTKGMHRARD
jgi:short-subunit dehydrogenase